MTQPNSKEDEKLFAQMSNAIRDSKFEDLHDLTASPEQEEKEEQEDTTQTDDSDTEQDDPNKKPEGEEKSEESDDKDDPATTPDQDEEKDDKEPPAKDDEKSKLQEALDLIEKVKKENHSLRSQAGRVPHLQRQVQQFDKKLEELKKLTNSPSSRPSTKLAEKVAAHLSTIKDADPVLTEALEKVLAEVTDGVAEDLRNAEIESLQSQREATAEEYRQQETTRLLEMYPNAPEVFRSASWKQWEEKQTDRMKSLTRSDSADDVAFAFEKYAEDMVKLHPELATKTETQEPVDKDKNDAAAKIEAERRRKKETAANVSSPAAAGRQNKPDNDEALFRQFSEQIRKEITG